ncbi:MAG: DUF6493 family protein [Eubacteriales bacterium]|nr:DUF6493 family protein [Eubacteriales bacterium]
MNEKLERALEIYRKLGYEETDFAAISSLGVGTKEEQKLAKEGLQSGAWTEFRQLSKNTYGTVNLLGVDLDKLAVFAIRAGVDVRRAMQVLHRESFPVLEAIAGRGEKFARNFVEASSKANIRPWEHSASVFGALCVRLVHQMSLAIPENVSYLKDWVFYAEKALNIGGTSGKEEEREFFPTPHIINSRFQEHIEIGIAVNAPATGPFSKVLVKGVSDGLLGKEQAKQQVFLALDMAARPGDRKEWIRVLEEIGMTEEDILERAESLMPLLAFGETAITEKIAPVLIERLPAEKMAAVLISSFAAKSKKTKQLLLKSALQRERPVKKEELGEWLDFVRSAEDKSFHKLLDKLAAKWNIVIEEKTEEEQKEQPSEGLWQRTPPLWQVPEWSLGEISPEQLTALAAEISRRKVNVPDIVSEKFLAMTNALAWQDAVEAKRCLVGLKNQTMILTTALGDWARNQEIRNRIDFQEKNVDGKRVTVYSDLLSARDVVICSHIEELPCVLSTPSREDLSICLSDLTKRLLCYQNAKRNYVYEADLQLALTRLDISAVSQEDLQKISQCPFYILLPDGKKIKNEKGKPLLVSQLLPEYLKDPYVEPELCLQEMSFWNLEIKLPQSLRHLPNRFYYNSGDYFSIFPLWGDFALTCVRRDTEVYHGQGLILRQIARRGKALGKAAVMNLLAVPSYLSEENAEDVLTAIEKTWQRGLLQRKIADVRTLDWHGGNLSNLAAMAAGWEQIVSLGVLPVLWEIMDEVVAESLQAPRMIAGTADIVKLMQRYLKEVLVAVENGLTTLEDLELKGVRTLAKKSGSSLAVTTAKEIVKTVDEFLNTWSESGKDTGKSSKKEKEEEIEKIEGKRQNKQSKEKVSETEIVKKADGSFEEIWKPLPKVQTIIFDGVEMQVDVLDCKKSAKPFVFSLKLPDISEYEYKVVIDSWVYSLESEGQVAAIEVLPGSPNTVEYLNANEKQVWLHWDEEQKKIVVSPHRNWRKNTAGPLKGDKSPLSESLLTIGIALLAQDGDSLYYAPALIERWMASGILSQEMIRQAIKILLQMEAVSPAKLVRVLEKETTLFSLLCVMLPECVRVAGERTQKEGKPPVWVNRVLDICLYYADILKEAAQRGLISEKDAKWQGLDEIAHSKAKSAAKQKAEKFLKWW